MRCVVFGILSFAALFAAVATAEDSNDDLVKKDRKRIEGTWKIVALEINGSKSDDEDTKKMTVVNGSDGTWSVRMDDKEILKGTSTFYPTQKPKMIDFTPSEGDQKGQVYLGIYELGENTRKLCFAPPGKARPTDFTSTSGSDNILVSFEREKAK